MNAFILFMFSFIDEDSLTKAIMARQAQREAQSDNFLDQLAAKYGNGDKGKKKGGSKKK